MEQKISVKSARDNPPPQPSHTDRQTSKNHRREWLSTVLVIILAPVIALLLTAFVFQSYEVDGPSMETTLSDNDRLIVNKIGRTWASITGSNFIPERNEIVVFSQKSSTTIGTDEKQLIKRIIGLPGDRVAIKDGRVTIYNDQNPDGMNVDETGPQAGIVQYTDGNIERTIGEDEVFVLGDNRKNSLDSRSFGPVNSDEIVGTLAVRIYPLDSIDKF